MKTQILKTIAAVATGLILSFNAHAKGNPTTDKGMGTITINEIKSHVMFPNFIQKTNHTEEVKVTFTVDESGKVNFVYANTSISSLKQSIESQFSKLTLSQLKSNNAYSIQFNFKTI